MLSKISEVDESAVIFLDLFAFPELGKRDTGDVRSRTLESLGDSFNRAVRGQIGWYRDLALSAYKTAIEAQPERREPYLKLAGAYAGSFSGDPAENGKKAECHLNKFLKSLQQSDHELRGIALDVRGLVRGRSAAQLDDARADFQSSLAEFKAAGVRNLRARHAGVLTNLAKIEAEHKRYSLAARYYREALSLFNEEELPSDITPAERKLAVTERLSKIALAQRNLAATLLDWAKANMHGDQSEYSNHVEEAVNLLHKARLTTDKSPDLRARAIVLLNLAMAYALRIEAGGKTYLSMAKELYRQASVLFHDTLDYSNERRAVVGEAGIAFELLDWREATAFFKQAVSILDIEWLRARSIASRVELFRDYSDVYGFGVLSAVNAQDLDGAVRILEYGRNRLLRETLYSSEVTAPSGVSGRLWRALQGARQKTVLHKTPSDANGAQVEAVERYKRDEERILGRIRAKNPNFIPVAVPLSSTALCDLGRELKAELWIAKPTRKGTVLLVVTATGRLHCEIVPQLTSQKLSLIMKDWITSYEGFRHCNNESDRFYWWTEWKNSMKPVVAQLNDMIISRFLKLGQVGMCSLSGTPGTTRKRKRIYMLASGMLDLIPWHAAAISGSATDKHLIDLADVGYFSCGTLLRASAQRQKRSNAAEHLLMFTDTQVNCSDWLASYATGIYRSSKTHDLPASASQLKRIIEDSKSGAIAVFSCHAKAHGQDALKSGLFKSFANSPCISLSELLGIRTEACKLVVLNTCESSLAELGDTSDEGLSLANAFLATGAGAVVGTQWCAEAFSSALWCGRFLQLMHQEHHDPLRAACLASIWLRDATYESIVKLIETSHLKGTIEPMVASNLDTSHPFSWANHKYYGASIQAI